MRRSAGQAIIFALLLTAVVITVGLAVVSQSIVDIKTSTQSQETVKAFTAAEAGIEQALGQALVSPVTRTLVLPKTYVGNAYFNASVNTLGLGQSQYIFPRSMVSGDAQTLWLVSHKTDGGLGCGDSLPCVTFTGIPTFDVYFGNYPASSPTPALVIDVYYKADHSSQGYGDVKIVRTAYDPDSVRQQSDNFTPLVGGQYNFLNNSFAYKTTVNLSSLGIGPSVYGQANGLQIIRARILYATAAQPVAFDFASNLAAGLPSQGYQPQSVGTVTNSSSIKLSSVYPWPDSFAMFDHAIFAGSGSLCKGGC